MDRQIHSLTNYSNIYKEDNFTPTTSWRRRCIWRQYNPKLWVKLIKIVQILLTKLILRQRRITLSGKSIKTSTMLRSWAGQRLVTNNMDEKNNLYILNNKKSRSISRQAFLKDSFKQCAWIGAAIARMRASAQMLALLGGVFEQCACA